MVSFSSMDFLLDCTTPKNRPLSARYKRSFAYQTMKDRCPVIITRIIDSLSREKICIIRAFGEQAADELKATIGELSQLKSQLQTNKPLECFKRPEPDLSTWNEHFEKKKLEYKNLTYFEADWLFAECYLYRKIREIFVNRAVLSALDPFWFQKCTVLTNAMPLIQEIVKRHTKDGIFSISRKSCRNDSKSELAKLIKGCLWANRADLSKSGGETELDCIAFEDIKIWDCNILIDDSTKVYQTLLAKHNTENIVEYILDNAGFELFSDLCLADYLILKCGVRKVNLRAKPIPWYVSDATRHDIDHTVKTIASTNIGECQNLAERWQNYLDEGIWDVKTDMFWCTGHTFSEMPCVDPRLYDELQRADLLIIKGDLNYRKLVQDMNWDPTIKFSVTLGNFHPAPLVALRTCKADTISGLAEGVAEKAGSKSDEWLVSGEFAVIQFDSPLMDPCPPDCNLHHEETCPLNSN